MSDTEDREALVEIIADHDWRWAIRDSRTGDGVRIACTGSECDWFAERVEATDDVWSAHQAHLAAALAPLLAAARVEAAEEALAPVRALAEAWSDDWSGHDVAAPFARALGAVLPPAPTEPEEGR